MRSTVLAGSAGQCNTLCWRRSNFDPPRRSKFTQGGALHFKEQLWISVPNKDEEFVEGGLRSALTFSFAFMI